MRRSVLVAVCLALAIASSAAAQSYTRVGDMLVPAPAPSGRAAPSAVYGVPAWHTQPWPEGVLPIMFDAGIDQAQQSAFYAACAVWGEQSLVTCVPGTAGAPHVQVSQRAGGCYSMVGQSPAPWLSTPINLDPSAGCWTQNLIIHEIGHALGLEHEHQRPDRDTYVRVQWQNVRAGDEDAFRRLDGAPVAGPYDFASIMQYGPWAFSNGGGPTLVPLMSYQDLGFAMGTATRPSTQDYLAAQLIYGHAARAPQLHVTRTSNPAAIAWTPTDGTAFIGWTVYAGTSPGASNLVVAPLPGALRTVSGMLPVGVPVYVRIVGITASGARITSNEVVIRISNEPPRLDFVQVSGSTVTLRWTAPTESATVVAYKGTERIELPVHGTQLVVTNVPSGWYSVAVEAGGMTSHSALIVVP